MEKLQELKVKLWPTERHELDEVQLDKLLREFVEVHNQAELLKRFPNILSVITNSHNLAISYKDE